MILWRIVDRTLVKTAFSGQGAFDYGGRWNSPGVRVVYCSEHPALAAFEKLVHIEDFEALRQAYVLIPVECRGEWIKTFPKTLPKNWDSDSALSRLRALGNAWVESLHSVGVFVPSVVLPRCNNILLNPSHPDFGNLKIGRPVPFDFDPRLERSGPPAH